MGAHRSARPGRARADGWVRRPALTARGLLRGLVMLPTHVVCPRAGRGGPSCPDHRASSERSGNGGPVSGADAPASLLPSVSGPDRAPRHDGRPSSTPACRGLHHRGDSTLLARFCRHRQVEGADPRQAHPRACCPPR